MTNPRHGLSRRHFLHAGSLSVAAPLAACAVGTSPDLVQIGQGRLRGVRDNGVVAFRGIPYAGDVRGMGRFRPAPPPPTWDGVRPAMSFGPSPVQGVRLREGMPIAEDCLTLNVWAPENAHQAPVFVWIYGGSNVGGTSASTAYDGATFARAGIVCVTLNYREGAFGFLALHDLLGAPYALSGNAALTDQIAALRWVRDNIAAFGGNPGHVVLGGESAGAKNVLAVATSTEGRGLCHGLIMESGGGQTVFSPDEATRNARAFCATAGLDPDREAARLRTQSATRLLAAQEQFLAAPPCRFPFRSVVDGQLLKTSPLAAVQAGAIRDLPLLIGSNADESHLFLPANRAAERPRRSDVANMNPDDLPRMEDAYDAHFPAMDPAERHWRLLTAEEYWIPTLRVAEAQRAAGGAVWMYRFDTPAARGHFVGLAPHAAELAYVWDITHSHVTRLVNGPKLRAPDLAREMHARWIAFIEDLRPDRGVVWPSYDPTTRQTMVFNARSDVQSDPRGDERALWTGVL
ncbi:carboxylesterase type B [Ameyamaea chiangmaiensis NBRC 103196]|uniref:Carboxylic ester hydrolase n=1 Tax=Ameyamaea chiangmaiensis TaxID=442969 RepID=A0A850P9K9_9PROT|nr:carboxylesterase family protein [Ameyamaea chiangmaiensis]MBS4075071.1 carboxylesterase/lipase family protein [Ameyamaea chiangmaiensis]NVN41257.1 carboxylesterase/lipase family protein [Ameyamaea chiangmaiensis]GBQ65578.1 carboxylesterase type B [Ameyamaea chiangmaiensis NBRC 103196]